MNKRQTGRTHEEHVCGWLKARKYKVIKTNYNTRGGEIDIIAKDGDALCFVEVKAREKHTGLNPLEAVDLRKQKRIIHAAKQYMNETGSFKNYVRFDVAGVLVDGNEYKIEYIKDAFGEE